MDRRGKIPTVSIAAWLLMTGIIALATEAGFAADSKPAGFPVSQTALGEGEGASEGEALAAAKLQALMQVGRELLDSDQPERYDAEIRKVVEAAESQLLEKPKSLSFHPTPTTRLARVVAQVRTADLAERLTNAGLLVKAPPGKGASPEFVRITAKVKLRKEAVRTFYNVFDRFPFEFVRAELAGKPTVKERDEKTAEVTATVRYSLDAQRHQEVGVYLDGVLQTISTVQGEYSLKLLRDRKDQELFLFPSRTPNQGWKPGMALPTYRERQAFLENMGDQKGSLITICTKFDDRTGDSTWKYYFVPGNSLDLGISGIERQGPGRRGLELLDADGNRYAVLEHSADLSDPGRPKSVHTETTSSGLDLALWPLFVDNPGIRRSVSVKYRFLARVADLERYDGARFTFQWSPPWSTKDAERLIQNESKGR